MLTDLWNRVSRRIARLRYAPAIVVKPSSNLIRIGSAYGGWTFERSADLEESTILSCGLGEDASFDIEFAARFNAKVIVVDPTPRAIRHFEEIEMRVGRSSSESYVSGGKQPPDAYDLRKLVKGSLLLEPLALWVEKTKLKMFAPPNPDHVSYSITTPSSPSQATTSIEVATTTPEDLLAKYHLEAVPLMKLDIEGAEINVIMHMLDKSILPRQLLVEFDEMNIPSALGKKNVERADAALGRAGYQCRYFDGRANVLYVLS